MFKKKKKKKLFFSYIKETFAFCYKRINNPMILSTFLDLFF